MTRIARRDGLHEAPRTTLAHQLDTALDSRSGVDPCERPALHTRPDPPNDPGLDPGVDVAPSPERGGHHPCRRVAEMRRRPGSTCSIFTSDRADQALAEDHEEPGQQSHGWVWRCRDRPPHRRCTRSPSPWACQESAPGMSRWIPPIPVPGPFIHRRAVRAVRHLAESPPCPVSAVQNPRRRRQAPLSLNDRRNDPRNGSTLPPHPPALPGTPR